LERHPSVARAVVTAREDTPGHKRLVAYAVAAPGGECHAAELREALAESLPEYMVPAAVVVLDAFPMTVNGKVDRGALPAPEFAAAPAGRAPASAREELLCSLFAEVLHVDVVGVEDSFFELGGDSIVLIQLIARARRGGLEITPRQVLERRTVAALAEVAQEIAVPEPGERPEPAAPLVEMADDEFEELESAWRTR